VTLSVVGLLAVTGSGIYAAMVLFARSLDAGMRIQGNTEPGEMAVIGGGAILAAAFMALIWLRARDGVLSSCIAYVLRGAGRCPGCQHSLIGLPVPQDRVVRCPECGRTCRVHRSLSVLEHSSAVGGGMAPNLENAPIIGSSEFVVEAMPFSLRAALLGGVRGPILAVIGGALGVVACYVLAVELATSYHSWVASGMRMSEQAVLDAHRSTRPDHEWKRIARAAVSIESIMRALDAQAASSGGQRQLDASSHLLHIGLIRSGLDWPATGSQSTDEMFEESDRAAERLLAVLDGTDLARRVIQAITADDSPTDAPFSIEEVASLTAAVPWGQSQTSKALAGSLLALGTRALRKGDFLEASLHLEALCVLASHAASVPSNASQLEVSTYLDCAGALVERGVRFCSNLDSLARLEAGWKPPEYPSSALKVLMAKWVLDASNSACQEFDRRSELRHALFTKWHTPSWMRYGDFTSGRFVPKDLKVSNTDPTPDEIVAVLESRRAKFNTLVENIENGAAPTGLPTLSWRTAIETTPINPQWVAGDLRERRSEVATIFAAARWKLQHGRPPESMSDLVPGLLASEPAGRASGMRLVLTRRQATDADGDLGIVLEWIWEQGGERPGRVQVYPRGLHLKRSS